MALLHRASITPTKAELLERWLPTQPWFPDNGENIEVVGAFRFDDPEGKVGIETHLVKAGETLLHVPMTYREAPLGDGSASLIGEMEHSALGSRWIYDGLGDARYVAMLAGVALTGQGEALGMAEYEARWYIAPSNVRISGGGWTHERVAVDGFLPVDLTAATVTLRNDRFALTFYRRPQPGAQPAIGLTATWDEQPESVVLAEIRE